ncbi:SHOCT domain-containing protein [Cellulomonas sp. P5_C6]
MPGLIRAVGRTAVVAGTATAVSNRVSRRQAGRWAAQEPAAPEPQYAPPPPPQYAPPPQPVYVAAPPPPAEDMDAKLAQLTQLGALRDAGVLSDAEFEVQKSRILSS